MTTTSHTATISIEKAVGYNGKMSERSYVARITGTDEQYIFAREFLETAAADKNEKFTARRKGRGSWTEAVTVEQGVYEICQYGERRYVLVWWDSVDCVLKVSNTRAERAQRIALLLDGGMEFDAARRASQTPK